MANKTSRGNTANRQNPQGANRTPKINLNVKSSLQTLGDTVKVSFEVAVFENLKPLVNQMVVLKEGISRITGGTTEVPTDALGIAILETSFSLEEHEVVKVLRITLEGRMDEITYPINLPAKKRKIKTNEAETLMVFKHQDEYGFVSFKARVLTTTGVGVGGREVNAWYKGVNLSPSVTNAEGEVIIPLPIPLNEGEEEIIIFSVSEIKKPLKIKLKHRVKLTQAQAFTREWFYQVNNGRAFVFFCVTLAALIITIMVGIEPMLNDSLFRGGDDYTSVQSYYNDLYLAQGFEEAVVVNTGKKLGGVPWWAISLMLFIAAIFYGAFAAREEIAEAYEEMKLKMVDRSIITVDDPFLERIAATMTSLGVVSNKREAAFGPISSSSSGVNPNDKDGDGRKDKKVFGSSMLSYLTLDLVTDLALGVAKRVFR